MRGSGSKWSLVSLQEATSYQLHPHPTDVLQGGHLGYIPQKVHCTEVRYEMRKKPVPALGETGGLNFFFLFPRAETSFPSSSALFFSFGLTQAVHIQTTVPGWCLCAWVWRSRAEHSAHIPPSWPSAHSEKRKFWQSLPDTEGNEPDPQQR